MPTMYIAIVEIWVDHKIYNSKFYQNQLRNDWDISIWGGQINADITMNRQCSSLGCSLTEMLSLWFSFLVSNPMVFPVVKYHTVGGDSLNIQFLLKLSVLPMVIWLSTINPDTLRNCFYLTRTWNYSMHMTREKIMNLCNLKWNPLNLAKKPRKEKKILTLVALWNKDR